MKESTLGVIVGRFQVPTLHPGHIDLFNEVLAKHDKLLVVLGNSPVRATRANPLDFHARRQMLEDHFSYIGVGDRVYYRYVQDEMSNEVWSKNLDEQIANQCKQIGQPSIPVILYGSRDSFIPSYSGVYQTEVLEPKNVRKEMSGTSIREGISKNPQATAEFRAGAVWSAYHRYPTTFTTVDVAIFTEDGKLVLGRKKNEELWRFIGGFSEPNSPSFEADAIREAKEETGLELGRVEYIGSFLIDDWRYRKEIDKIKTLFFIGHVKDGRPEPGDDIQELSILELDDVCPTMIVKNHRVLLKALQDHLYWKAKAI